MSTLLRCIAPLRFIDATLEVGEVVEQLVPTAVETCADSNTRGCLQDDEKRDRDHTEPRTWIVIGWRGARRRVPLRAFQTEDTE